MGVEYRGQLVVGYTYEEAEEIYKRMEHEGFFFLESMQKFELTQFGPCFDACKEDSIFGVSVVASEVYSYDEVDFKALESAKSLIEELEQEFGKTPKIYIMAEGY